jgi:hypothetical protein
VGSGGRLAPPVELANFVVAHSEYSSPLMRRNLLSALVGSEVAELEPAGTPAAAPSPGASKVAAGAPDGSTAP